MMARILVVVDNEVMLKMLSALLSRTGHQIDRAESGEVALTLLSSQKMDLIISDLAMSTTDNIELCRQVRSSRRTSHLPIIAIGPRSTDCHVESLAAGVNCYLTKPLFFDQLLKSLDELLP